MLTDFNPPHRRSIYDLTFLTNNAIKTINKGVDAYRQSYQFIRLPNIKNAKKQLQQIATLSPNELHDELYHRYRKHYYDLYKASHELKVIDVREKWYKYFNLAATWAGFKRDKDKKVSQLDLVKLQLSYQTSFGEALIPLDISLGASIFDSKFDELHLSWLKYGSFARHSSFGLQKAAEILITIEDCLIDALTESASKPWFMPKAKYEEYRAYLADYQKQLEAEKNRIAEAMLKRLQLALNKPGKDDVIEFMIYDLAKLGAALPKELLDASRKAPEYRGLTPELAVYFRLFIERYCNEKQRVYLNNLCSFSKVDKAIPLKVLAHGKHELIVPADLANHLPKTLSSEDIHYLSVDTSIYRFMHELPGNEADVSDNELVKYIRHCDCLHGYLLMALTDTRNKLNRLGFFTAGKAYKKIYLSGIENLLIAFQARVQDLSERLRDRKQHKVKKVNDYEHNFIMKTIRITRDDKEFLVPSRLESLIPIRPRILESIYKDQKRIDFFQSKQALLNLFRKPLPDELYDRAAALAHLRRCLQDEVEQSSELQKQLYFWQSEYKLFLDRWLLLLVEKINVVSNEELDLIKLQAIRSINLLQKQEREWELIFKNVFEKPTFNSLHDAYKKNKIYDFQLKHYQAEIVEARIALETIQESINCISAVEINSSEDLKAYIDKLKISANNKKNSLNEREKIYNDLLLLMNKQAALNELPKIDIDKVLGSEEKETNELLQPLRGIDKVIEQELNLVLRGEYDLLFEKNRQEWKNILNAKLASLVRHKFSILHEMLISNRAVSIKTWQVNILKEFVSKIECDIKKYNIILKDYEQNLCKQYFEILQFICHTNLSKNTGPKLNKVMDQGYLEHVRNITGSLNSIAKGDFFSDLAICRKFMHECQLIILSSKDNKFIDSCHENKLADFYKSLNFTVKQAEFFCIDILASSKTVEVNSNLNAFICFGLFVKLFGDERAYQRHIERIDLYINSQANYISNLNPHENIDHVKLQSIELICAELNDDLKQDVSELKLLRTDNKIDEYKIIFSNILQKNKSKSPTISNVLNKVGIENINSHDEETKNQHKETVSNIVEMRSFASPI